MGITYIDGIAIGDNGAEQPIKFLVDSGSMYSLIPKKCWESFGLTPKRTFQFELADGQRIERPIGECKLRILGHEGHTPVVLGEENDEPLLGVVTLEEMGLVLDPFKRELIPAKAKL